MRWSIASVFIATVIASCASSAEARRPRGRAPVVAPTPPSPPHAPLAPMPPPPPMSPLAALPPDAPLPPHPPGAHAFSFAFGRGRLGVGASSMTEELRRFFGAGADAGILVQSVETGTPADKAGVKVGDVIVRVDGDEVAQVGDVAGALADRRGGEKVEIEVIRAKKTRRLLAELRDEPGDHGFSWRGGDVRIEGLPPGAMRIFGGGEDDEALREQLERLTERLERLERKLDRTAPRPKSEPPKRAPRRAPRPAGDHT